MTAGRGGFLRGLGRLRSRLTLPLFVKELTEAATRRRTYVIRTLYAGLLFVLAIVFARDVLFPVGDAFGVLGQGGRLYLTVMLIQFAGVYLFLPALTAPSITGEKERNTLGLLLLTKLSPTKIVLEKYLGRVFPMLCLVLLSLPLLGVAYSLGGLEARMLLEGIVRLVGTICMVGAIGIACSAWCRTTAGAFLSTWGVILVLTVGPAMAESLVQTFARTFWETFIRDFAQTGANFGLWSEPDLASAMFFGPLPLIIWLQSMNIGYGFQTAFFARSVGVVILQSAPLFLATLAALIAARLVLVRRAEARPRRYLVRAFRAIDARFRELNDRYAKGIELIRSGGTLPEDAPVAWRETTKTTLGSFRYLVRILLLVETPVLFLGVLASGSYDTSSAGMLGALAGLLWAGGGLLVAVKGASLFTGERARQSLDVLLTTPLGTREIVRQKLVGIWRLIAVCLIPVMTAYALIAYMHYSVAGQFAGSAVLYLFVASVTALTHLSVPAYLSTLVGLRVATQSRAMLTSVALLAGMCLTGPVLKLVIEAGRVNGTVRFEKLCLYSPAAVVAELTGERLDPGELIYLLIGNGLLYGGLAVGLRWACYAKAGRWLSRTENGDSRTPPPVLALEPAPRAMEWAEPAEVAG